MRIRNESVLDLAGLRKELVRVVQMRKLRFFGHLMRHESLQRNLLEGMVDGKRCRGRPRNQWTHNVLDWTGKSFEWCKEKSADRLLWRRVSSNPRTGEAT